MSKSQAARTFSVRICSTSKKVVRLTSCGIATVWMYAGRKDPRPASAYPQAVELKAKEAVTRNALAYLHLHLNLNLTFDL